MNMNGASLQEKLKKLRLVVRAMFQNIAQEYFDNHPFIEAIKWHQYTSYYDDGCPIVFEVAPEITIKGDPGKNHLILYQIQDEISEAFDDIEDSLFEFAFGDPVEVTITRHGINIKEYYNNED